MDTLGCVVTLPQVRTVRSYKHGQRTTDIIVHLGSTVFQTSCTTRHFNGATLGPQSSFVTRLTEKKQADYLSTGITAW